MLQEARSIHVVVVHYNSTLLANDSNNIGLAGKHLTSGGENTTSGAVACARASGLSRSRSSFKEAAGFA
jgi:hypothetical protein